MIPIVHYFVMRKEDRFGLRGHPRRSLGALRYGTLY